MERRAGFEPATSRLGDEVTAIFTTDRERIGGVRAMLLLLLRATDLMRAGLEPARPEVTDVFTTALPMYVAAHRQLQMARWGTGDIGCQ
jgi:hypothetical protein